MTLKKGILAKHVGNDAIGMVISLDPATRCCGYAPCNCNKEKYYTPMAKIFWQTGHHAGKETTIWANLLRLLEEEEQCNAAIEK